MHSSIPVPRESWSEMLEIILAHNGIGIKKLNSYTRQLFIFKQDPAAVQAIASRPEDLLWIPTQSRVCFVLTPPLEQARGVFQFFERFSDSKQTFVYQVGRKIALISSKDEVEKLLTLYNTVWDDAKGKISRVVPMSKINAKEMEKILQSFFMDTIEKARPSFAKVDSLEGLTVLSLGQGRALVLIGQQEIVDRAEKVIHETEEQLQDPLEMTVFLYSCKHSDPTDLAKVLEKVYLGLLSAGQDKENIDVNYSAQGVLTRNPEGYPPNVPPLVVQPPPQLRPEITSHLEVEQGADHFIPDPKTGTLLMVIRRDALIKIKDLLHKLDVPKKMVQIEVLLFEKRLKHQNNFGLNLLKIGSKRNGLIYEAFPSSKSHHGDKHRSIAPGILELFFAGSKSKHFPAYDIAYNFLMAQEDIQLNAAPSVITVNQTPATISIVEEISINNGAAPVNTSNGTIAFEQSFSRAQYGITIVITPTIHLPDKESEANNGKGFVTLQTNITFDTTTPSEHDRPLVDKRHIENEVRVLDEQTVVLGGLKRKSSTDHQEKIPFFGDLPGLGKFFGTSKLTDHNTEMIFFITPKIIADPQEEMDQLRTEDLKKRPGDIPEFLERAMEARNKEKKWLFENSFKLIFGN